MDAAPKAKSVLDGLDWVSLGANDSVRVSNGLLGQCTSKDMGTFPLRSDQSLMKAAPVTAVPIDPISVRCLDEP